jgi:hypothetical protein
MHSPGYFATAAVAVVAALAVVVTPSRLPGRVAEARRQAQLPQVGLVPVAGHWTVVDDSGAALRGDGERWAGTTPRAELLALSQTLFGVARDSGAATRFADNLGGSGAFPLAVWRDVRDFRAGTIRVRFKLVGGKSDQNAGIVFGLQPSGDYLYVRYNTKDGDVALWEFTDGARKVIAHGKTSAQLALGAWHELELRVAGRTVTGSVNGGALQLEHTLDRAVMGRVGVWTKRDAVTVFRGYRVVE